MQRAIALSDPPLVRENLTVPQFISAYAVCRTKFYELMKQGRGPRILRIGRRVLINRKAAEEWVAQMEQHTAAEHTPSASGLV